MKIRNIAKKYKGKETYDGAGVKLIRVVGHNEVKDIDPFLMLDAFDSHNPEDYIKGFPMHPHRGIETVTYLINGEIKHSDSLGNSGSISSGESQWMTAGSGILHEEMPVQSERLFGLQLWVNLPKEKKMTQPKYHDISKNMIKTVEDDTSIVKVVSGNYDGKASGIKPEFVDVLMLDITVKENKTFEMKIDEENTVFLYVIEGEGEFGEGDNILSGRTAAILSDGDKIEVKAHNEGIRFILFSGRPLKEPISWGGPIVTNTEEELRNAFNELRNGTFIKHSANTNSCLKKQN